MPVKKLRLKLYTVKVSVVAYDSDNALLYVSEALTNSATAAYDSGDYDEKDDPENTAAGRVISVESLGSISEVEAVKMIGIRNIFSNGFIEPQHDT